MTRFGHEYKTKKGHALRNPLINMVRPAGLEPAAHGLKARASSTLCVVIIGFFSPRNLTLYFRIVEVIAFLDGGSSRFGHATKGVSHAYI